ncbi:MAG: hypothetical protein ABH816_03905 [Candidatus Levyibacteriota bacterium]
MTTKKISTNWGYVKEIVSTKELGVSLLIIKAGRSLPAHYHKVIIEYEIIIKGDIKVNGKKQREGSISVWKPGKIHEYVNDSSKEVKIPCITIPPYSPSDEIPIKKTFTA